MRQSGGRQVPVVERPAVERPAVACPAVTRRATGPGVRGAALLAAGVLLFLLAALAPPRARAQEASVPARYRLADLPPVAADGEAADAAADRAEFLYSLPATFSFDSLTGLDVGALGNALDRPRATVRYRWFSHPSWDIKVGLSATRDPSADGMRFFAGTAERLHAGGLPTMHLFGEGRLADRWMLSVNAEGLRTARGLGLDMDLRVDYSLTRYMALFGSYRMTDSTGEGQDVYGFLPSNAARLGVRLRF